MSFEQRGRPVANDARHGGKRATSPKHADLSAKQKKHLQHQRPWQNSQQAVKPQAPGLAGTHDAGAEQKTGSA